MIKIIEAVQEIAKESAAGAAVDLTKKKRKTAGNSVTYNETQDSFGIEGLERVIKHALEHDRKVGGWMNEDDGQFYYDSIRIFTDLEEAKRFGRENRQIAIFDLTNLRLIKL